MKRVDSEKSSLQWFLRGAAGIISIPAFILMGAFVGFCSFSYETGVPMVQVAFMTGMMWALPGQLILIGAMIAGASLPAAAIAVGLSSMRLMPMVTVLIPEIRSKSTPTWKLLFLSHFIAVTTWVYTMQNVRDIPENGRLPFFAGFGITMTCANVVLVAVLYGVIDRLPEMVAGALFFLTPIYFITSIWASARTPEVYFAMVAGLILGPIFHHLTPGYSILVAGIAGGIVAFALERTIRKFRGADES
ncbi:AzlC family ABC transporter permease [Flavimaribacter sediminis]